MFLTQKRGKSNRKTDFFVGQLKFVGQFFFVHQKNKKRRGKIALRRTPQLRLDVSSQCRKII